MEVEKVRVEPATVVDDVLSLFWERAASKNVDLAGYVSPDAPVAIEGDPVRLNQVLSNLVNNALKFTDAGHVFVTVKSFNAGGTGYLEFAVHDTGIGIPQDKISKVFESFSQADQSTTRKYGGTGLGLPICKRLVEAMGGQIGVTSNPGRGSVFKFQLTPATLEAAPDNTPETGHGKQAVVAVSGEASAGVIAGCLKEAGISAAVLRPDDPSFASARADFLIADTPLLSMTERAPVVARKIAVSQLGEFTADRLISDGTAQDILMRPITSAAARELAGRMIADRLRGQSALDNKSSRTEPLQSYSHTLVLVADDSPVNREVVVQALQRLGVQPDLVEDGAQALDAARRLRYNLILMDGSMPVMDGFEAHARHP